MESSQTPFESCDFFYHRIDQQTLNSNIILPIRKIKLKYKLENGNIKLYFMVVKLVRDELKKLT